MNISEVGTLLGMVCRDISSEASSLTAHASRLKHDMQTIQSGISGTCSPAYTEIMNCLNVSLMQIERATTFLYHSMTIAEQWARPRVGSLIYPGTNPLDFQPSDQNEGMVIERSATNSYERANRSPEESNVFLRQHSAFSTMMLSMLPDQRKEAVESSYANAPMEITDLLTRYSSNLTQIKDSGYGFDSDGHRFKCDSNYDPRSQTLAMDESMNHAEYVDVIKHELGHFVDHMKGTDDPTHSLQCYSDSQPFVSAVAKDASALNTSTPEGRMLVNDMLDDLFSTGACNDRNVTDIISAVLCNEPIVVSRFQSEGVTGYVAYYKHDDDYWYAVDRNGQSLGKREKEVFANEFAIETDGYRISKDFIERWFPNIYGQMQECIYS